MSIHDDVTDGSGTMVYCDHWLAAAPNSYRWISGPLIREQGASFLLCGDCFCYCDVMDVVVGDFGDLHCVFCGSDFIHISDLEGNDE